MQTAPSSRHRSAGSPAPFAAHRVLRARSPGLRRRSLQPHRAALRHDREPVPEGRALVSALRHEARGHEAGHEGARHGDGHRRGGARRGADRGPERARVRLRSEPGHARAGEEGVLRAAHARRRRLAAVQERAVRLRDDGHRAAPRVEPRAHVRRVSARAQAGRRASGSSRATCRSRGSATASRASSGRS